MGYNTDFEGRFKLSKALTPDQVAHLDKLVHSAHRAVELLDIEPSDPLPRSWCQWVPSECGNYIEWDGEEKFSGYIEWLQYMVKNFFVPWKLTLNGVVKWYGAKNGDVGVITVIMNEVQVAEGHQAMVDADAMAKALEEGVIIDAQEDTETTKE